LGQELAGKVAIVTGGASGIGRATVELFVERGARVVIADVDTRRGEELAGLLGPAALFKRTDVAEAEDIQSLVDFAVDRFGGLQVMVNNAGISGALHNRFLDDTLEDFRRVMDVNVLGVMLGSQRAARHMAKQGGGSIINTTSIAADLAGFGVMTYRASKAAVAQFSRSIAIDLAEYGIRVNCIAPGHIPTEMTSYAAPGMTPEAAERVSQAVGAVLKANQPLKRQGTVRDVAQAALYLAADCSAQVTGMVLPVDGGTLAGDPINHLEAIMAARSRAMAAETEPSR
jgi:NAD(P)-dependent dehydrogenase (short-subunit alcohol dehydrogenase family)